jgi:hypothetical protein
MLIMTNFISVTQQYIVIVVAILLQLVRGMGIYYFSTFKMGLFHVKFLFLIFDR